MQRLPVFFVLLAAAAAVVAGEDWLSKASEAVRTRNYEGVMVYLRDDDMDTLRIVHRYRDGKERERLISLTGEPREIIRDDGVVTCVLPKQRMVLVARHSMQSLLANVAGFEADQLKENYRIRSGDTQRLADRMCQVVFIEAKDEYRYGYRLLIDQETSLPLKLELLSGDRVLEQMMFTEIAYPENIPDSALAPTFDTKDFRWVRHQPMEVEAVADSERVEWRITDLPPGFELVESGVRNLGDGVRAQQFLFTDGIATVSVFVAPAGKRQPLSGATTMGAVNAYGRRVGDYQITAVGEVPEATVRHIADHFQRHTQSAQTAPE